MYYIVKTYDCTPLMPGYSTLTAAEVARYNLIETIVTTFSKNYDDIASSLEVVAMTETEAMRLLKLI